MNGTNNDAIIVAVSHHLEVCALWVVFLLGLARELGLDVLGAGVRIPDVTVGAVGLDHEALQGDGLEDLAVFFVLHRAAIDADEKIEVADCLHLFKRACEAVDDASWEPVAVLTHYVDEVVAGVNSASINSEAQFWIGSFILC